jgi:hypothetical protein
MEEKPRRTGRPKGSLDKTARPGRKLLPVQVVEIRRLYDEERHDYAEIQRITEARGFPKVSRQNIEHIVLRKIWKGAEATIAADKAAKKAVRAKKSASD